MDKSVTTVLGVSRKNAAWNGSLWVLMALTSKRCATSSDGITWTSRTMSGAQGWQDVAWNGTLFCAVGSNGGATLCATSPDGVTWTEQTATTGYCAVAWNGSVFCAVGNASGTAAATSPDGVTWTARTLPTSQTWADIAWNGTVFCAVSLQQHIGCDIPRRSDVDNAHATGDGIHRRMERWCIPIRKYINHCQHFTRRDNLDI